MRSAPSRSLWKTVLLCDFRYSFDDDVSRSKCTNENADHSSKGRFRKMLVCGNHLGANEFPPFRDGSHLNRTNPSNQKFLYLASDLFNQKASVLHENPGVFACEWVACPGTDSWMRTPAWFFATHIFHSFNYNLSRSLSPLWLAVLLPRSVLQYDFVRVRVRIFRSQFSFDVERIDIDFVLFILFASNLSLQESS